MSRKAGVRSAYNVMVKRSVVVLECLALTWVVGGCERGEDSPEAARAQVIAALEAGDPEAVAATFSPQFTDRLLQFPDEAELRKTGKAMTAAVARGEAIVKRDPELDLYPCASPDLRAMPYECDKDHFRPETWDGCHLWSVGCNGRWFVAKLE